MTKCTRATWLQNVYLTVVWSLELETTFSNSLIIHKEKTKEITTVKEVWICDPNYHKIRRSFALIFSKNYQCEVGLKNPAAPRFFNPLLSVWIYIQWNTLPRVWYITWSLLLQKLSCSILFYGYFYNIKLILLVKRRAVLLHIINWWEAATRSRERRHSPGSVLSSHCFFLWRLSSASAWRFSS